MILERCVSFVAPWRVTSISFDNRCNLNARGECEDVRLFKGLQIHTGCIICQIEGFSRRIALPEAISIFLCYHQKKINYLLYSFLFCHLMSSFSFFLLPSFLMLFPSPAWSLNTSVSPTFTLCLFTHLTFCSLPPSFSHYSVLSFFFSSTFFSICPTAEHHTQNVK